MTLKNKKQSGRSMIEMLGVLAIIGILSAGGIAGYSMAMQSHKTNQLIEKSQLISQRSRELYKGEYTGISKQNLINSGMLTERDFQNPFGGSLGVQVSGSSRDFQILINGPLPVDACVKVMTTDWGFDVDMLYGVAVTGVGWFRRGLNNYPVSIAQATSACKNATGGIVLDFR